MPTAPTFASESKTLCLQNPELEIAWYELGDVMSCMTTDEIKQLGDKGICQTVMTNAPADTILRPYKDALSRFPSLIKCAGEGRDLADSVSRIARSMAAGENASTSGTDDTHFSPAARPAGLTWVPATYGLRPDMSTVAGRTPPTSEEED